MPVANCSPELMRCLLERLVSRTAILVYDGKLNSTPVQIDNPSFYTRVYRLALDGKPVNTWIRFIYNQRDGWADMRISVRDLKEWDKLTYKEEKQCSGSELASTLSSDSELSSGHLEEPVKKTI